MQGSDMFVSSDGGYSFEEAELPDLTTVSATAT